MGWRTMLKKSITILARERSRLERFVSRIKTTFRRRRLRSEWTLPPSIFLPSHFSLSRRRLISAKRRGKISVLQTWLTSRHHLWRRRRTRRQQCRFGRLVGRVEILWWPHQPLLRVPSYVPSLIRTKLSLPGINQGIPVQAPGIHYVIETFRSVGLGRMDELTWTFWSPFKNVA